MKRATRSRRISTGVDNSEIFDRLRTVHCIFADGKQLHSALTLVGCLLVFALRRRPFRVIEDGSHREFLMMICFRILMASVFTSLLLLFLLPIASGQTAPHKPLPTEPLETYNNPPAPPRPIETSQRMTPQPGPFTHFQPNVAANDNNIRRKPANEPS